jgi:hypothetical protein
MLRFKSIIAAVIAVSSLFFAFSAMPALAAGLSVDPTWGGKDTTFDVSADGFNPKEVVSTWIQLSNGKVINEGQMKADADGSIEFSVTADSSWSTGEVIAVAHGQSSKREYSAKFNIAPSGDDSSSDTTSSTDTTGKSYVSNAEGTRTITYYGSGYTAGERVATWYQYPNELSTDTAHALPDVYADASGNVSFTFTVGSDWTFGGYDIAARGYTSKHVTHNTFSYFGSISDQYAYDTTVSGTIVSPVWTGYYWNNTSLSGNPVLTRQDSAIDFNWGEGSPAAVVNADNFSARWDSVSNVASDGTYLITATADDGIRVWVDGGLVIDQWSDHGTTTYTATVGLSAGNHSLRVEYYEHDGGAVAIVNIARQ